MKRALVGLMLALVAATGCMPLREEHKPPKAVMKEPAAPPAVSEHGITEQNAAEKAAALRRELEADQSRQAVPEPGK